MLLENKFSSVFIRSISQNVWFNSPCFQCLVLSYDYVTASSFESFNLEHIYMYVYVPIVPSSQNFRSAQRVDQKAQSVYALTYFSKWLNCLCFYRHHHLAFYEFQYTYLLCLLNFTFLYFESDCSWISLFYV